MSACNNGFVKMQYKSTEHCADDRVHVRPLEYNPDDFKDRPGKLVLMANEPDNYFIADARPCEDVARGVVRVPPGLHLLTGLRFDNSAAPDLFVCGAKIFDCAAVDVDGAGLDDSVQDAAVKEAVCKAAAIQTSGACVSVGAANVTLTAVSFSPAGCECGCLERIKCFKHVVCSPKISVFVARKEKKSTLNMDFKEMGVGGYTDTLVDIAHRVFMSRIMPDTLRRKQGVEHIKGMILHGPPGTGKTLIARTIAKMLGFEIVVQRGPELMSKWVGESEDNVRKLFAVKKPTVFVFDEMEALFAARVDNDHRATKTTVATLLAVIDGVAGHSADIFLIGTTNDIESIDPAFRRPGRFECEYKIGVPSRADRESILRIHAKNIMANGMCSQDIDLSAVAAMTDGYSGAQLEALVRRTIMLANTRHIVHTGTTLVFEPKSDVCVSAADFSTALAACGAANEQKWLGMYS